MSHSLFSAGSFVLSQEGSTCSNSTVLVCSYTNLTYVGMQALDTRQKRFNTLSSYRISRNPDFEESFGENVYRLKVSQVQKYNYTQYRCSGINEDDGNYQYSNQWKIVIPGEFISIKRTLL